MLDARRLEELAAAVADGHPPDLDGADADGIDESQRQTLVNLHAIAAIAGVLGSLSSDGATTQARPAVLAPGAVWGTLRIIEWVGAGRFGDVYRAWDPALHREVALKLMRSWETGGQTAAHVVHEGHLMARVQHANVVTIFGAQRIGAVTGLWMEFVSGRTLAGELEACGCFDANELVATGVALCAALSAVHDAGLVHRDVKAQNVMRDARGRVVLSDFGAGRELPQAQAGSASLAGTPMYVAPEIFAGRAPSPQSDVYSLGVLLFHLASGDFPVCGPSLLALREAHARGERRPLRALRPDLPARLCAAVDTATAADPARRFADAASLARALASSPPLRSTPHSPRGWVIAAALAVVTTGIVGWLGRDVRGASIPFAPRDLVLVTAFDNRTGEPRLDGALEHALERELTESSFLTIVPRQRVSDALVLMRRPVDLRVDEVVGREVALRDGQIRVLLSGRVERLGPTITLTTRIVRPTDGSVVASLSELTAGEAGLSSAVRRLAARVRRFLGERRSTFAHSGQRLAPVTTPSLTALRLYSEALALLDENQPRDPRAAAMLLRQAIHDDPTFALAHLRLAELAVGLDPDGVVHLDAALSAAAQTTEAERLLVAGIAHRLRGVWSGRRPAGQHQHFELAAAALGAYLRLQPDDTAATAALANVYRRLARADEANALDLRMADLRPTSPRAQIAGARAALASADPERARLLIERARLLDAPPEHLPPFDAAWLALFDAHDLWQRGDVAGALAEADRLSAALGTLPHTSPTPRPATTVRQSLRSPLEFHLWSLYVTLGRLDQARAIVRASRDMTPHEQDYFVMMAHDQQDDPALLRRFLRDRTTVPEVPERVGSIYFDAEMIDEARALVAQAPLDLYVGQLALVQGRLDEAVRALGRVLRGSQGAGDPGPLRAARKLADALVRQGRTDEATGALEAIHRVPTTAGAASGYEWLKVRDLLARVYRNAGRVTDAERVEAELRSLLAVADATHPIKRRIEQLQRTP